MADLLKKTGRISEILRVFPVIYLVIQIVDAIRPYAFTFQAGKPDSIRH